MIKYSKAINIQAIILALLVSTSLIFSSLHTYSKVVGTHNFNNWLVSRTVDGAARNGWNPGRRVFIGQVVKVDDAEQQKMNKVIDEAEKSGLLTFREGL